MSLLAFELGLNSPVDTQPISTRLVEEDHTISVWYCNTLKQWRWQVKIHKAPSIYCAGEKRNRADADRESRQKAHSLMVWYRGLRREAKAVTMRDNQMRLSAKVDPTPRG